MRHTLVPIIAVQLFICGWIGYAAIAIYRGTQNLDWLSASRANLLHLVFSPVAGLLTIYWISVLAIPFPRGKMLILAALLIFATWKNVNYLRKLRFTAFSAAAVFAFFLALAFLVVLNSQDLLGIAAKNYFPRTNGDTFSYLSQMDQFRIQPLKLERQIYPAGFSGYYSQSERNGPAALGSFFANAFSIDSHVAFFATLRLMLVCMLLGFLSILLVINLRPWIIAPSFLIYACGCFYLNTVLQQYLSSTSGVLAAIGVIFSCCLWIQSGFRRAGTFLVGASFGLLLIYSPEAFPTLLLAFGLFMLLMFAEMRGKEAQITFPRVLLDWSGGLLTTSLPLIFDPVFIFSRIFTTLQHYVDVPYDIRTYEIFGLYLVGLRGSTLWLGFTGVERFLTYSISLVVLVGSGLLLAHTLKPLFRPNQQHRDRQRSVIGFLSILAAAWVALQVLYASRNMTYVLVKEMDYYNFLPCLIFALVAGWLVGELNGLLKWLGVTGLQVLSATYVAVATPAKSERFAFYHSNVIDAPPLDAYLYPKPDGSVAGVVPALQQPFALDLFYYMNRWRTIPLRVYNAIGVEDRPPPSLDLFYYVKRWRNVPDFYKATDERKWGSYRFLPDLNIHPLFTHRFCLAQKWSAFAEQKDCVPSRESMLVPVNEVGPER